MSKVKLPARTQQAVDLLLAGACNKDIAQQLGITELAAKHLLTRAYTRFGIFSDGKGRLNKRIILVRILRGESLNEDILARIDPEGISRSPASCAGIQ